MLKKEQKFILIAGPCVIEDERLTFKIAQQLKEIAANFPLHFIFKASFDKANRTRLNSFRGPGLDKGLTILKKIKDRLKIPVLSDVHCVSQIKLVEKVLDVIQIPAFLCRQTDLILEASRTKKTINIKKGQFLSPYDVKYIIEKVESTHNRNILLTERGTFFGYNNLVVDFRSFGILKSFGYPVIFDVTHSLQRPSSNRGVSGGERKFVVPLGRAAVSFGVDGIFCEVHPQPQKALSDKYTSIDFKTLEKLLKDIFKIRKVISG
ncbi:MAG TPA: 3-deoxy-8-phosphooctulonate synthase [Candidatus Omnitrophica bacterium]|nr:MAG: 3-deoxy-8-phosphooctulonate synthase [Candidatus Omnitrophota bacterium]RKY45034.1 MAG: 3-deoxy-8-phosphooctulonate synthase [Candidatus Omnitrophota bacterium]HEC69998.1 3-deoxy-8-phosphooctulonate synthase [Candidatus Omnitrophota bacterium]